jgi:hypothetical protein
MTRPLASGQRRDAMRLGPVEIVCLVGFVIGLIILVWSFVRRR